MRKNAQREQLEHIVCSNKKDGCNEKHFKCKGPEVWTCIKIMEIGTNQYVTLYMGILYGNSKGSHSPHYGASLWVVFRFFKNNPQNQAQLKS